MNVSVVHPSKHFSSKYKIRKT